MARRVYTVTFQNVAVSAQQDLFYVAPADDKPVAFIGFNLGQTSDLKDAEEEGLRVAIIRGHATVGSGGSSVTPAPASPNDTAAGFTARVNDTTVASAGTATQLWEDVFINRAGYIWQPTPEQYLECSQAALTTMVVRLLTTPADAMSMSGTLWVMELI